jgi:hypothetical protein
MNIDEAVQNGVVSLLLEMEEFEGCIDAVVVVKERGPINGTQIECEPGTFGFTNGLSVKVG